ncbi:hypothetical protein GJ744_007261 [Endocarpon pusillum]|uniref:type I protein arginine methyltransferase n=1 Tax=Endocarpon pusillum TaxID=364733 RepID=A0A8H7AN44_9EURO|nr:hypothetical protein GJ744_007261 [Endocarpon pusillum]
MESDSDPSTTELLEPRNDDGWEDVESDVEDRTFKSLFEDKWFGDITEMLQYDKEKHDFDYVKLKNQLNLDFLDRVQLINFVRAEVKAGNALPKVWTTALFEDEQYLKPTMEDDAVLYSLDDIDEAAFDTSTAPDAGEQELQELRERLAQIQIQFAAYREEVQVSFQKHVNNMNDTPASEAKNGAPDPNDARTKKPTSSAQEDQDTGYFHSYASNPIHETMLKDTIRTSAYRDFIYKHKDVVAGKTILDIGCGTGILSLFCARAGAKLVLAVDNSAIIDKARVIVYENGFQDVIRCVRGKIEEVRLPVPKVDVIVSEWMGYGLLYESMLDSVLWARDRYLDPERGLMVPSHATLRLAPLVDSELRLDHVDFWKDVYGFDMTGMLDEAVYDEALVRTLDKADVPSSGGSDEDSAASSFLELDLHTATTTDLTFLHPWEMEWRATEAQSFDGWAVWFDIFFLSSRTDSLPPRMEAWEAVRKGYTAFSTGPAAPQTHWQQVALLAETQEFGFKQGQLVRGKIGYQKKEGKDRSIDIEVMWQGGGSDGDKRERRQVWTLD